ncbi:MAG: response regulator [Dehalococcoidia bacterium]
MRAPNWESLNPKDASVLVVEDNPDDARVIARVLQNFGISRMSFVSTGEEAVAQSAAKPFDVVLTDFGLPGMNGLRVLERITEVNPQTKVIIMTGLGDEQTAVMAMKLGASDYIPKDELLTSGVVNSLQAALRSGIAARTSQLSRMMDQGADRLEIAEAEADWLILFDVEGHGYRKMAPISTDEDEDNVAHVREMMCRYLELTEHGFLGPTQKEEEGLVAAFVTRGMSSQAMLSLYRSSIRAIRQSKRLDGKALAMNPTASFCRVLSRVIEEYQYQLSMSAVPVAKAA